MILELSKAMETLLKEAMVIENSGDERFENEDDNDYDNIDRDEDGNF